MYKYIPSWNYKDSEILEQEYSFPTISNKLKWFIESDYYNFKGTLIDNQNIETLLKQKYQQKIESNENYSVIELTDTEWNSAEGGMRNGQPSRHHEPGAEGPQGLLRRREAAAGLLATRAEDEGLLGSQR